jgi:hypothetical protein
MNANPTCMIEISSGANVWHGVLSRGLINDVNGPDLPALWGAMWGAICKIEAEVQSGKSSGVVDNDGILFLFKVIRPNLTREVVYKDV